MKQCNTAIFLLWLFTFSIFADEHPNSGTQSATGNTHQTVGGAGSDGLLHPFKTDATGQLYIANPGSGGGGGGGGNITASAGAYSSGALVDGAIVTEGAKADAAATNSTSAWSMVSLLKGLYAQLASTLNVTGSVSISNFPAAQTVLQSTGTNLHTVVDNGSITANQGSSNATPWNQNISQFGGASITQGQTISSSSIPVAIASDQSAISTVTPYIVNPQSIFNYTTTGATGGAQINAGAWYSLCVQIPTISTATYTLPSATTTTGSAVITMASTTGAYAGQVVTGTGVPTGAFIVSVVTNTSITLNVPCTASGTVTLANTGYQLAITWQSSPDNYTWSSLPVLPKTVLSQQSPTATTYGAGLYVVQAPATANYIRANITTMSGCTANIYIQPFTLGSKIDLPYVLTSTQANWPTGGSIIPPIETTFLTGMCFDLWSFTGTGQNITWQQSNDPNLANAQGVYTTSIKDTNSSTAVSTTGAASAAGVYMIGAKARYFYAKETGTAITAFVLGGFTGTVSQIENQVIANPQAGVNIVQIGGGTLGTQSIGGSTNKALPTYSGATAKNTDYNAQAWAAASGSGATIASDIGGSTSYDVNLSAWTVGSSTGLDIFLQWSPDGGTTWYDQWQCEALTAVGHVYIPPIFSPGQRRMRWVNRGGAATTATVTVNANGSPISTPKQTQFFDRTAGLLSGTLNATSAAYDCSGCGTINMRINLGAATTAGTYQIQISDDNSVWSSVGTATLGVASSSTTVTATNIVARYMRAICTVAASSQTGNYIALTAKQ